MNEKQRKILEEQRRILKIQIFSKYCFLAVWVGLTLFISWMFGIMVVINSSSTNKIHKQIQEIDFKLAGK